MMGKFCSIPTRWAVSGIGLLAICAGLGLWLSKHSGNSGQNPGENAWKRPAPPFVLKDRAGHDHTLAEARGKIVLVHFWAAWCPPCLAEIPELTAFARRFSGEKLRIFAISLDARREDAEKVLDSSKLPPNMVSLLAGESKISEQYGTYQYPETYLIDSQGRILVKWVGGQPWSGEAIQKLIRQQISRIQ